MLWWIQVVWILDTATEDYSRRYPRSATREEYNRGVYGERREEKRKKERETRKENREKRKEKRKRHSVSM